MNARAGVGDDGTAAGGPATRAGGATVTVRTRLDGVNIHVEGRLDDASGRALLDVVDAAIESEGRVVVEVDPAGGFSSDAIRDLAECAHRGALLRFQPPGADAAPA